MPFSFTFSVPGVVNPFATASAPINAAEHAVDQKQLVQDGPELDSSALSFERQRRRPSPSPSPSFTEIPRTRKRGWAPPVVEPSTSVQSGTSASGYLDTPARYRDMAQEDFVQDAKDLPPTKRRRTLVGQIASTALSAALIGTAVGVTVYRLWRDRGKEPEAVRIEAPPPYEEREPCNVQLTPPTPTPSPAKRRPQRIHVPARARPAAARHRRVRAADSRVSHVEPADGEQGTTNEDEDQMDWIGSTLAALVEEGKRALAREVVVAADAPAPTDDEGVWVEEDAPGPSSRASSIRPSPRRADFLPAPSSPRHIGGRHSRGPSADASVGFGSPAGSVQEDPSAWGSVELRGAMEAARLRARERMMGAR